MKSWKDEIDQALGQEPKFKRELQEKILKKASKRHLNWQYPVTVMAFMSMLLFLIVIGPTQVEQPKTQAIPFDQLIEQAQVEQFFISSRYTSEQQFFARDSSRYMEVHSFKAPEDALAMNAFLHAMKLVEIPVSHWMANDVLVEMSNGEQLKLKVSIYNGDYLVQDVYSKLNYIVEQEQGQLYTVWLEKAKSAKLSLWVIFGAVIGILALSYLARKLLKLPKDEEKKRWSWKSFFVSLLIVLPTNLYFNFLRNHDYVMHKDVHFFVISMILVMVHVLTKKPDTPRNKQLYDGIVSLTLILFIGLLLYFG